MGGQRRRATGVDGVALAAAMVPFAVAAARAAATGWMPIGDAAYFTVRSVDVFSRHVPLLGAWSSGSAVVGVPVNNLGPLQLYLLAPFTRVSPYLGTGIGSAVINAAAVAVVWAVAVRLFRPLVVVAVMAGTTLFVATLGLSWLIDARQQYAMVLPLFALLWLSVAMWAGVPAAAPAAIAVGSLAAQTHFTFAYQAVLVVAAGIAGFASATWADRRAWRRVAAWSAVVAVVCWLPPVIDELWFTGNLGDALGPARGEPGPGLGTGVQLLAGAALDPPFWLPGSIGDYLLPDDGVGLLGAALTVVLWAALCVAVVVAGVRRRVDLARAAGAAGLVALAAGLVAAAMIPVSMFGLVPQNYYWAWAVAAFVTIVLPAGLVSLPGAPARVVAPLWRVRRGLAAGALIGATAIAVWPRYPVASVALDEVETRRVAEPLGGRIRDALGAGAVDDVVEVDLSRALFANDYTYVLLAELQRAGIEFRFPPGSRNLDRFGESRCAEGGRYQRLLLISGRDPELSAGSRVIASVETMTGSELDEYAALQEHIGEALRAGAIAVDPDDVERMFGTGADELREVLAAEGRPAGGLGRQLVVWESWGIVDVPTSEAAAVERWAALELRAIHDFQTVVLENPAAGDGGSC
jgi:hypothetical protein